MGRNEAGLNVEGDQGGRFPWVSKRHTLPDGVELAYLDEGPRDAALTFLLVHGNPTWGFLWRRFIAKLSAEHRVVVPDHVGFGRSDKPQDPQYYSLKRHEENLASLLKKLDLRRVVPVVHDWGGPIGMRWAANHPDRIAGVGILNTWAFVKRPTVKLPWIYRYLFLGKGGWRRIVQKNAFIEKFLARRGTARPLEPAVLDAYRAPFPRPADRVGMGRFPQLVPETEATTHESWNAMAAIEDALPALAQKPALIVWALGDVAFRKPQLERWKELFPDHELHLLPEAKHYLQEDAPDAIVDWLQAFAKNRLMGAPSAMTGTSTGADAKRAVKRAAS